MALSGGRVVSNRFPYVRVSLGVQQLTIDDEALLDTGFDGDVVVPARMVRSSRPPDGFSRWSLADGSRVLAPYYVGTIEIGSFGPFPIIAIVLGDEPIIGIGVAQHLTITLDHAQRVIVDA